MEQYKCHLNAIAVRPFNCIGVGQNETYVVPKLVSHFRNEFSEIKMGNVDVRRDFVDVRDVARMYLALIQSDLNPSAVNFCSGKATSIKEIIEILAHISGKNISIIQDKSLFRENENKYICGDDTLLKSLPFRCSYSLTDTLNWMLENQ